MLMKTIDNTLCDWAKLDLALQTATNVIPLLRDTLLTAKTISNDLFTRQTPVADLVRQRAAFIDQILVRAWALYQKDTTTGIALVAVGGYGRGELHPASDIDLMILLGEDDSHNSNARHTDAIEKFLMLMWDIGLEAGHSVRTVNDCIEQGTADITVVTNLMEARLIDGDSELFGQMQKATGPDRIWPGKAFFQAKRTEQTARHHRYGDTAYNLEPNIKENPGGLRDIQVIGWVAKRHFGATTLRDLIGHGFLTEEEYQTLEDGQNLLWKIRFALHMLTGRREDRLLFDNQRIISAQFGYEDGNNRLGVEHFMKQYYCTVLELNRLNEMLLQLFDEVILNEGETVKSTRINNRFKSRNGYIELTDDKTLRRYPFAILEIFLILQQHPELKGVRAETIRLIRSHRHLIDDNFRNDLRCQSLFMEIFRQPHGLTHELRRMNRYGVLAAYLPVFSNIVGQMQHDLFHVYTVDEHTMFVVRNLRRFTVPEFAHEFPLCSKIINRIPKQELLYIAGFFHDIAKGRGGDHSQLGATDAIEFCEQHGLSRYDTSLVAWLIRNHLTMSTTAQRKDISDPEIINQFASMAGSQDRLDYLYLLTVADIRATSPGLWNSWKNALLAELYHAASRALRRGLENPESISERIQEVRSLAQKQLQALNIDSDRIAAHWDSLDDDYFIRHSVDEIVWHAAAVMTTDENDLPIVLVREKTHRGGTEIFVCTRDTDYVFAVITATLGRLGLNITDARITTSKQGYTYDTFIVLENDGKIISDKPRINDIIDQLTGLLKHPDVEQALNSLSTQTLPRQLKQFPMPTSVTFRPDEHNNRTIMEVIARDQPGLLAKISAAMVKGEALLQNAKIATLGERAEDIFFITDRDHAPYCSEEKQTQLEALIIGMLQNRQ